MFRHEVACVTVTILLLVATFAPLCNIAVRFFFDALRICARFFRVSTVRNIVSRMACYRGCVHGPTCVLRACAFYCSYGQAQVAFVCSACLVPVRIAMTVSSIFRTPFTSSYAHLQAVVFAFCFAAAIYKCSFVMACLERMPFARRHCYVRGGHVRVSHHLPFFSYARFFEWQIFKLPLVMLRDVDYSVARRNVRAPLQHSRE
jgi:hypothetical protein